MNPERVCEARWRVPDPGCYVPAVTLFDPASDRIDHAAQAKYFAYLASTGLAGIVVLGTNAETLLLTREERAALVATARKSVPPSFPIVAGISGHSTAQVLEYARDAAAAGADFALLLPCAYFGRQTTAAVIRRFFADVAAATPLPLILYNFPAVCNGVDLDSDTLAAVAREHPQVVGVKLTCGSVGKMARLAAEFGTEAEQQRQQVAGTARRQFAVFGGQSDFLLGGLAVGGAGCIAAFANVFPRSVARLYRLWKSGQHDAALRLQHGLALAEAPTKAGIASTKYAAAISTAPRAGIDAADAERLLLPRRPYERPDEAARAKIRAVMGRFAALEDEPPIDRDHSQQEAPLRASL